MRTLFVSPLLWRMVGGFAVGTVMTFGLSMTHDPAPLSAGTTVELAS